MIDIIHIDSILCDTLIGVYHSERDEKQPVSVSLKLGVDVQAACESDHLQHTIDYKAVSDCVASICNQSSVFLCETLAYDITKALFESFPIETIDISLTKTTLRVHHATVTIQLFRRRQDMVLNSTSSKSTEK